jgi:flagella basal body P-ring formation protein FlgA
VLVLLAIAASVGSTPSAREAAPTIAVTNGIVVARDLASASPAGDAIVMRLPRGVDSIELNETKRRNLLRARFPGGRFTLRQTGALRVVRRARPNAARISQPCFVGRRDIPADAAIGKDDVDPVSCRHEVQVNRLFYHTASASLIARRDLPAGTYLGAIKLPEALAATKGDDLVYRTAEGPVTVERKVVALQNGRSGGKIFVRTEDGRVLVSTLSTGDAK